MNSLVEFAQALLCFAAIGWNIALWSDGWKQLNKPEGFERIRKSGYSFAFYVGLGIFANIALFRGMSELLKDSPPDETNSYAPLYYYPEASTGPGAMLDDPDWIHQSELEGGDYYEDVSPRGR